MRYRIRGGNPKPMCTGDLKVTENLCKSIIIFVLGYLLLGKGSPKLSVSIPSARMMFVIRVDAPSEVTGGGGWEEPKRHFQDPSRS